MLLRPGKDGRLRRGRARWRTTSRDAGIPIAGRIEAPGTIDGGDTLWLDRETLLVGRGYRTNAAGVEQLAALFPDAEVLSYDLPHWNGRAEVMHLMSLISPLADDLALVYPRLAPVRLIELLHERGIEIVEVPDEEFETMGPNVLALGPRHALALEGNDETRRRMEAAGRGGRHLQGRRDLPQGRRRPDVPDAADPACVESGRERAAVRGDRRRRRGRRAELARRRAGARGEAERGGALAGAPRALQREAQTSSSRCSTRTRRSTSSTPPPPGARAGWRSCSTPSPSSRRNWSADGFTPLHYAAFFGQEDAARILLERGAEVRSSRATRAST